MPSTAVTAGPHSRPTAPATSLLDHFSAALRERPFVVAAVAAVLVSLLAVTAFTPHYETNDDTTMNLIAAGLVFTDRPDEHLVFTNVLIGLPLRELYRASPRVPWYGMYQFATIAAAAAALTYAFVRVNPSGWQAVAAGLFLAVAVLPCLVEMQFTRTASLASFGGLALLLAPLRGASPWPRLADAAGCALLVLGSLIRFESFLLAGVVFLPVAAVAEYATPARAIRRAVPVAGALAAAVALYFANVSYYARDEGWRDFYAYNALRARFTDYTRYSYNSATRPAFDAAGWDEIDYWMLMNWFYADRDRYSLARLQAITATAPTNPPPPLNFVVSQLITNLPHVPGIMQLMLAVPCVAFLTGGEWRRLVLPAVLFGFAFALVVLLAVAFWLPIRVGSALFTGALAGAVLGPGGVGPPARRGRADGTVVTFFLLARLAAGGLAVALVVWAYFGLSLADGERAARRQKAEKAVRELKPRPDQLFVVWREYFPFDDLILPLSDPAAMRPFRCVSMSWLLPTPFTDRVLSDFGVPDIYLAVCDRPDVYLVAMPGLVQQFIEYVRQHYRRDVVFHFTYGNLKNSAFQVFQPGQGPGLIIRGRPMVRAPAAVGR